LNIAQLLFPDFSLILCGYLVCRFTPLQRQVWEPLELLVYYFLFPALLFHSIVRSPLNLELTSSLIGAGVLTGLSAVALAYSLLYWPGLKRRIDPALHAASAQVSFRFNSFIGLALAERLAGAQGLLLISVLIGCCVPLFNIAAVWPMARQGQRHVGKELLRNPLILATLSGLLFNLAGGHIPAWAEPSLSRIGGSSIALGLMSAGAGLQFSSFNRGRLLALLTLGIRHAAAPCMALAFGQWFGLEATEMLVLLVFSALPTASTCYVLANRMGYDGPYVAGLVTASTLLGMVSLPFALNLLGFTRL
jgi:predicted permease